MDPITDLLNRIRNAQAVLKPAISLPFSNMKFEIAKILQKEGLVGKVEKEGKKVKKTLEIELRYDGKEPLIAGLKRVSKPGQRIYLPASQIRSVKGGYGFAIISTSKGLLTDKEARRQKIGGEVICQIW
jgi:small subunit ribosomal protein S8